MLEFPSRVRLGTPEPYYSKHLSLQSISRILLPSVRLGMPLFFLFSEVVPKRGPLRAVVMEFPTISGVAPANQRKGQNEKFMNFAHFCEFWCFSLGKQARFTLNFCSGMPLRKVHELTFLWFGLPGPLLTIMRVFLRVCQKILVSVKFVSAILRPEMAAPIFMGAWKNAFFLQENPCP